MHLKFGSYPVVVASSAEMAVEFLKSHDQIFATRPPHAAGKYTAYNYNDVLWAPYGPHWRQGRKIYQNELFSSKRLESFEYIRVEEMWAFVSRLYGLSGKPVVLIEHLTRLTLMSLQELQEIISEFFFLHGVFNIGDWIPWLDFLDLQGYIKRMKTLKKKLDRFHDHVFDEHKRKKKELGKDFVAQDMVDLLLQLADGPDLDVKLTYDAVRGLTPDLVSGGTDTMAVTVEWVISELMKQPHLITKATQELDRVIGRERWVQERDISQLPYLDAIMKETMRKHSVAPLLAPHMAMEDCKGRSFELLPFGAGRRMCPGYNLGLKMIQLSIANLLQAFNWKLPGNIKVEDLSMEEAPGITAPRKFPLVAVLEPRLPLHLYEL
ncbi:hypothetical protein V6N12_052186 [Hibiscus sabdariffa]|uniref:Flavonoid 3'-monooxygenase n=1 Tax=Hibiscus sabdariffa TaxID=183260 RepID=A0ABR2GHH7_9ROSI